MSEFSDLLGTSENSFSIGDRSSGIKSLIVNNGFQSSVNWNPTAQRSLSYPDQNGILQARVSYTVSNANFVIPSDADVVDQIATMTAPRTFTLPAIASVPIGKEIVIRQLGQDYGGLIALRLAPAGTDLIEGSNQPYRIPFFSSYFIAIATAVGWKVIPIISSPEFESVQCQRIFTPSSGANEQFLSPTLSGADSLAVISDFSGYLTLSTGITSAGFAGIYSAKTTVDGSLVKGSIVLHHRGRLPIIPTSVEDYFFIFGITETFTGQNVVLYCSSASANFIAQSGSSIFDTGVLVQAGSWHELGIFISDQIYFVINESVAATGLKPSSANGYSVVIQMVKISGTSPRTCDIQSYAIQFPYTLNPL